MEPTGNPSELSVWTDTFAHGDEGEIKELVIVCVLTGQTLLEVLERMKQWLLAPEVGFSRQGETAAGTG